MNWLDRVVASIAPAAAMRRAVAREALRAYEGGGKGRRFAGWKTTGGDANSELNASLPVLRDRSRDLCRNNPYALSAMESLVANAIGTGIVPKLGDAKAQALFARWVKEADAEGGLDFYGLQALIARTVFESGECLVRFRARRPVDGLSVPLQLQVLEPDFLDHEKTEELGGGGWIMQGVQFAANGRIEGYWLFDRHPGGLLAGGSKSALVPASELIHVFERTRPGQVRGVPRLAPVLLALRELADCADAHLMRRKIEACFTAFVTSGDPGRTLGQEAGGGGARRNRVAPGQIEYLKPGESVEFGSPSGSGGFGEDVRVYLQGIAAGIGVTYEQLSGDLSRVNYSSMRGGMLEFRRNTERWQWLTFVPLLCEPIMQRWLQAAWLSGGIRKPDITVEWTTPKWEFVDPVKDVNGELLQVAAGLQSWQEAVRRRGNDPDAVLAQIAEDQQKFAAAGVQIKVSDLLLGALSPNARPDVGEEDA